jgi:hypothetical protein
MRSRRGAWCGVLLIAFSVGAAHAAHDEPQVSTTTPAVSSFAAVDSAVLELTRDPNLGGETRVRTLRWTQASRPSPASEPPLWILDFFNYLKQISGLLLWVLGAVAVAVAAIWIFKHVGVPQRIETTEAVPLAGRVFDLDLRPDSLPDDVAGAALELSRTGRVREALSLLYRASLSRAVNRFGVVIAASLTEREALGAVHAALDELRGRYFTDLVGMRQRVVYAGEAVAGEDVAVLCARFGDTLDALPR